MSLSGKEAVKLLKNSGFVLQRVDRNGHYQMQRGDQRIMLAPMKPELDPAIEHRVRRLATNNPAARDLRRLSDNRLLPEEPAETGILVGARVAHIFAGLVGTVAEEDSGVLKVKWDGKDYTSRLPSENVRVLEEGTEMVEPEPIRQEEARPATARVGRSRSAFTASMILKAPYLLGSTGLISTTGQPTWQAIWEW